MNAKTGIRQAVSAALLQLPSSTLEEQSASACKHLTELPQWKAARTVALYLPLKWECNVEPLLALALGEGKCVLLPRVTGSRPCDMTMLQVESVHEVRSWVPQGKLGLREPPFEISVAATFPGNTPGNTGVCEGWNDESDKLREGAGAVFSPQLSTVLRADWRLCMPDLVLVPGVAFDATGTRLGKGKGYYDAWLEASSNECERKKVHKPFSVALALEPQLQAPGASVLPRDAWDKKIQCVIGPRGVYYSESK